MLTRKLKLFRVTVHEVGGDGNKRNEVVSSIGAEDMVRATEIAQSATGGVLVVERVEAQDGEVIVAVEQVGEFK